MLNAPPSNSARPSRSKLLPRCPRLTIKTTVNISVESEGTTVTHIAEIVVDVLGLSNVKFEYTGGDRGWKGDVPRFSYDISKVLSTGWKPKHTSDEAVRQTVKDAVEAGM